MLTRRTWLAAAVLGAAGAGARAQDSFSTEIRLAVAPDAKGEARLKDGDRKRLEESLTARLSIFAPKGGRVEVKGGQEIRMVVPVSPVSQDLLQALVRPGRLEVRELADVADARNPNRRYVMETLRVQDEVSLRFRDRETLKVISAAEFVERCPVVVSTADLERGGARTTEDGTILRLQLDDRGRKKLARFTSKTGQLMAIMLDGQLVSMPLVTQKIEDGVLPVTGAFSTPAEARLLAAILNAGELPVRLKVQGTKLTAEA